ncbi:MAG TPA: M50 family metallopeptidase [Thermoleophilaceae bacterium]|nr:M50 family metallopeptidase [Thermoleophilaceae bacterium]
MSWVLAFVGFALLVILHELGHFWAAKSVGMRVEKFSLFFPPTLFSKKRGETEYAIGAIPAGGYVKISGMNPDEDLPDEVRTRAYYSQPVWKRIVVIAAGPAMNLILAFVLMFVFFALIGAETGTSKVGVMETNYPAAKVLESGDRVVAVDGKRGGPAVFAKQIATHKCPGDARTEGCKAAQPVQLTVVRDGRQRTFEITPIYDPAAPNGDGEDPGRSRLGFSYQAGPRETLPFAESLDVTADRFWYITKTTLTLPARLLDTEKRKEISGVVGSYETTRQTILYDLAQVVGILAIISLSLAIVNLFPFLPLDGGHIFWAIVEKVRGRPVAFSVMERAGVVGFMLVILIFLVGLTNDIDRLSGEGFQVR